MCKYRSCHSVEGELFFNHLNKISYCSMVTPDGGQPLLYKNYNGELIDWDDFFNKRDEHIQLMKQGGSLDACKNCTWIREDNWNNSKKRFNYILLNTWVKCNLQCIYCKNHNNNYILENTKEYDLLPVLKDMIDKKLIDSETKIDFAGGESTLDKHFDEILNLFIDAKVSNININSNCTIFSNSILNGLKNGYITLISSIDAGDRNIFKKIKQNDLWNQVWSNIKKYQSVLNKENLSALKLKFIIVPSVNDSKSQILKFLLKSKQYKIKNTILNVDMHWICENENDKKTMLKVINLTRFYIFICKLIKLEFYVSAHIEDLIKRFNLKYKDSQIDIEFIY